MKIIILIGIFSLSFPYYFLLIYRTKLSIIRNKNCDILLSKENSIISGIIISNHHIGSSKPIAEELVLFHNPNALYPLKERSLNVLKEYVCKISEESIEIQDIEKIN